MDECRKSSFWYRSVPLMAITTGFMTYRRLNNTTPPTFYGLKLAGSLFAAYFLGKASYIPECRRLILQRLPNSNLAHSLESKPYDLISDMAQPPEIVSKSTATNIFGARNEEEEQAMDVLSPDSTDKNASRKYVTYDELRQRNRAEHATKFAGTKTRNDAPPTTIPTSPIVQDNKQHPPLPILTNEQTSSLIPPNASKRSNTRKNQYGDEVYE